MHEELDGIMAAKYRIFVLVAAESPLLIDASIRLRISENIEVAPMAPLVATPETAPSKKRAEPDLEKIWSTVVLEPGIKDSLLGAVRLFNQGGAGLHRQGCCCPVRRAPASRKFCGEWLSRSTAIASMSATWICGEAASGKSACGSRAYGTGRAPEAAV